MIYRQEPLCIKVTFEKIDRDSGQIVMDDTQVKANMVKKLELFAGRRRKEELGPGRCLFS